MKQNVCMVGHGSGVVFGTLGYTHCCIEDVALMRAIPGIIVVSPADCTETVKALIAAIEYKQSVYIRLTGGINNPIVYKNDYNFQIGKADVLRKGKDITIIAVGTMVYESLQAMELLDKQGISATVVNMHTLKPLDTLVLDQVFESTKLIITVEEHSIIGGLGSAVAEYKAKFRKSPPQLFIGLPDNFGKSGEYRYLLEKYGLTTNSIVEKIVNQYEKLS